MQPQKNTGNRGSKKESGVSSKNRRFVQNLIDDLRADVELSEVYIGRVLKKLGNGRTEVFFMKKNKDGVLLPNISQAIIRGSFRGKGKRSVWIDVGSVVAIADVGLAGSASHEIMAVIPPEQIRDMKKEFDIDPRIIAFDLTDPVALMSDIMPGDVGFEFDAGPAEEEINIDAI
jgi:hypothetical protein